MAVCSNDIAKEILKAVGLEDLSYVSRVSIDLKPGSHATVNVSYYPDEEHVKKLKSMIRVYAFAETRKDAHVS